MNLICIVCGHADSCNCGSRVQVGDHGPVQTIRCCGIEGHQIHELVAIEAIWTIAEFRGTPRDADGEPIDRLEAISELCVKCLPPSMRGGLRK